MPSGICAYSGDVRYGSKAGVAALNGDVCSTTESGHEAVPSDVREPSTLSC
jgi:hypothetical protein